MSIRKGVQAIEVREKRGELMVYAIGRTARGVKFIIAQEGLGHLVLISPDLKQIQTAAADKLLLSGA